MNVVIYDSNYGNTKIIAEAIAKELGKGTKVLLVSKIKNISEIDNIDLLIIGSPIIGWRPSEKMGNLLAGLHAGQLKNVKATAFDTRVKLFIHGDAANKIVGFLKKAGAEIIAKPQGFFVKGKEGPLLEGEVDRARKWALEIKSSLN